MSVEVKVEKREKWGVITSKEGNMFVLQGRLLWAPLCTCKL